jgi:hypothetical protein
MNRFAREGGEERVAVQGGPVGGDCRSGPNKDTPTSFTSRVVVDDALQKVTHLVRMV